MTIPNEKDSFNKPLKEPLKKRRKITTTNNKSKKGKDFIYFLSE
tara:strand:- start:139 stop:270 length:132 start_codon:yes stop_codon:yes gene_type:complete